MNQAVIHNELIISFPDGFYEMDREELKKLYLDDNPDRWGIWDQKRHIIVAVFWHESNALLSALAGIKDVAKNTEKRLRKGQKQYGPSCGGTKESRRPRLPRPSLTFPPMPTTQTR